MYSQQSLYQQAYRGCIPESRVNILLAKPWTLGGLTQTLLTLGMLVPKTRPWVSSLNQADDTRDNFLSNESVNGQPGETPGPWPI